MYPPSLPLAELGTVMAKLSGQKVERPLLVYSCYEVLGYGLGKTFPLPPAPGPDVGPISPNPDSGAMMAAAPWPEPADEADHDAHLEWDDAEKAARLQRVIHTAQKARAGAGGMMAFQLPKWVLPMVFSLLQQLLQQAAA